MLTSGYRETLNKVCSRQGWVFRKGDCSSEGPKHNLTWTCQVYVQNTPYEGYGSSKDKAHEHAAKNALDALKQQYPERVPDDVYLE